jgi:hypothetical protein
MVLALCNLVVVEASFSLLSALVNEKNHSEKTCAELGVRDGIHSEGENVAKHAFGVGTSFNGLLNNIDAAGLESDADDLFEVSLLETLFKLFVHDFFHPLVDNCRFVFVVDVCSTLFNVDVDALADESLGVLVVGVDVEAVAGLKGKAERVIRLVKVVENL